MSPGVFIAGTGTGVGKTMVTRGVVRSLARRGVRVAALKPVESGIPDPAGPMEGTDARSLLRASGRDMPIDAVCAYTLRAPLSPHLAAAMEGVRIDTARLHELLARAQSGAEIVIAESAGGLLSPLTDELLYGDFIAATGFAACVVARDELGAIHAALSTVEAARARGIEVLGVALSGTPTASFGNAAAIEKFGRVRILGSLPTVLADDDDALADGAEELATALLGAALSRNPRAL